MGTNGIGKSTALKILSGKLQPNLGQFSVSREEEMEGVRERERESRVKKDMMHSLNSVLIL